MVHSHSQCVLEECPRRGKGLTTYCKMTTDNMFYMMSILEKNMKKTRRVYIKREFNVFTFFSFPNERGLNKGKFLFSETVSENTVISLSQYFNNTQNEKQIYLEPFSACINNFSLSYKTNSSS